MIRIVAQKDRKLLTVFLSAFLTAISIWTMIPEQASYAETPDRKFSVVINGPDKAETDKMTSLYAQVDSRSGKTAVFEWKQLEGPVLKQALARDWGKPVFSFFPREPGQYRFSVSATMGNSQTFAEKAITVVPSTEAPAASSSTSPLVITINAYPQVPYASQKLMLMASAQGGPESTYTYAWKQTEGEKVTSQSGWSGNVLILPQGLLKQGLPYVFTVTVRSGLSSGLAVYRVVPK